MVKAKLPRLLFLKTTRANCHTSTKRVASLHEIENPAAIFQETTTSCSNWRDQLKEKLKCETLSPRHDSSKKWISTIYKVPEELRRVEPKAYSPSIVSIGPYHHGLTSLKSMEDLKWVFLRRLFYGPKSNQTDLDAVLNVLQELEPEARSCYSDAEQFNSLISSEDFVKMMLVDGCFVVELFRDHGSSAIKRWMLPTLRRDLIKLENQLPFFVLSSIFRLTSTNLAQSSSSFQRLALRFFNPLLQRNCSTKCVKDIGGIEAKPKHLLHLFRSSIVPRPQSTPLFDDYRGTLFQFRQPEMIRSATDLVDAGVKIERGKPIGRILEVTSEGRALQIPPLHIDDYKGTLLRNMVAFEKCHNELKPDVTTYLFFFDGLINSADDVGLLHYKGVLDHSLGSNREVARLVNKLCKEVSRDAEESYLYKVVDDANFFYGTWYAKARAGLVHHYFSSWVVGVSTVAAMVALYLTLVQTGSGIAGAMEALEKDHFHSYLKHSFLLPLFGKPSS